LRVFLQANDLTTYDFDAGKVEIIVSVLLDFDGFRLYSSSVAFERLSLWSVHVPRVRRALTDAPVGVCPLKLQIKGTQALSTTMLSIILSIRDLNVRKPSGSQKDPQPLTPSFFRVAERVGFPVENVASFVLVIIQAGHAG